MSSPAVAAEVWLVDASIALKWFLPAEREPDGALARDAIGRLWMRTTTLASYEVGNVLTHHSGWRPGQIASALALLGELCGEPIPLEPSDHRTSAELALEHGLTFCDASYVAIASRTGRRLISADRDLTEPGLALTLSEAVAT